MGRQPSEDAMAGVEFQRRAEDCPRCNAQLGQLIGRLETGEAEQFVLTKHGQIRAVVVSLDEFTAMRTAQPSGDIPEAA